MGDHFPRSCVRRIEKVRLFAMAWGPRKQRNMFTISYQHSESYHTDGQRPARAETIMRIPQDLPSAHMKR